MLILLVLMMKNMAENDNMPLLGEVTELLEGYVQT